MVAPQTRGDNPKIYWDKDDNFLGILFWDKFNKNIITSGMIAPNVLEHGKN